MSRGYNFDGVDDLAALDTLDEETMLEAIGRRHETDKIYTYIGDILVAVNPYKPLPLYTFEISSSYADLKYRQSLPPHVFAVADKAYSSMRRTGIRQCCVISGESGAGKTETAKYVIGHIISHCNSQKANLQEKILQVNPLLEAFGNAQTVMNDNSSRFGKFLELQFTEDGQVAGARIDTYLLEKSRVVSQGAGERNFHVFYYLFAGLTEQQLVGLLLTPPEKHRTLNSSGARNIYTSEEEFMHCQRAFDDLQEIMELVGFTQEDIMMTYRLLSAVIQIADIVFALDEETGGSYIVDEYVLKVVSTLLGIDAANLATALISNVVEARGEQIVTLKTVDQANDGRDALAKALYNKLFNWIVQQINVLLAPDAESPGTKGYEIGILDIYGFENFETNSFEQMCINLTNEQLQYYFNQRIFAWELAEYAGEGIPKHSVSYQDNKPVLDLFLAKPLGLLSILDEESRFPKASDVTFVTKCSSNHAKNANFLMQKKNKGNTTIFGIRHFASDIWYDSTGFLEKNRDTFSSVLSECMANSQNGLVQFLFSKQTEQKGGTTLFRNQKDILMCKPPPTIVVNPGVSLSREAARKLKKQLKEEKAARAKAGKSRNQTATVGSQFMSSLTNLMEKLLSADAQFIRCIKPNAISRHNLFDHELVLRQLRYTGVLETIRIRRSGYPTRLQFPDFLYRYKFIAFPLTSEVPGNPKLCKQVLEKAGLTDYHIGKTKVFLKYWHTEKLDTRMDQLLAQVVTCQRVARGRAARMRYSALRNRVLRDQQDAMSFFAQIERRTDHVYTAMVRLDRRDKERFDLKKRQMILSELRVKTDVLQKQKEQENRPASSPGAPVNGQYSGGLHPSHAQNQRRSGPPPVLPRPMGYNPLTPVNGPRTDRSQIPTAKPQIDDRFQKTSPTEGKHVSWSNGNTQDTSVGIIRRAVQGKNMIQEEIISELSYGMDEIGSEAWCKVYFMEKRCRLSDYQIKSPALIIDGYAFQHPGRLGFGALTNPLRDQETKKVREHIGKGVQLEIDSDGNVWATRLGKNEVYVKGCFEPENHCISADVIERMGRLPRNQAMKVFDIVEYKVQLALEAKKGDGQIDSHRLKKLGIVSLSFVKDKVEDFNTPCWISVVVLPAIKMDNPRVLRDVNRFLKVFRTAAQIEDNMMGRETSRKWARVNKRRSNFEKEDKKDGRRARMEAMKQAKKEKQPFSYSWEEDDDQSEPDVSSDGQSVVSGFDRSERYSNYSETGSVYYNSEVGDSPGYGQYGGRTTRRSVFRAVSIRNADAFRQRNLRSSLEDRQSEEQVTSNYSGYDLEKKREWARVRLIKKERQAAEEY
ncbi:myosin-IIIb-like [Diadema antillarum]|uniref:myosin-IIIb-like n=1 Tax=Diadema antillarum TaxID=105358 RepID=UPI003A86EFAC